MDPKIRTDVKNTIVQKMLFKVKGQKYQTKVEEHKIAYKKCSYLLFAKSHHS